MPKKLKTNPNGTQSKPQETEKLDDTMTIENV